MGRVRTINDPFTGQTVEIRHDLAKRLRGQYASGPTLSNGEPEFGWRQMPTTPIQIEAADEIERCHKLLREIRPFLADAISAGGRWKSARERATSLAREIDETL